MRALRRLLRFVLVQHRSLTALLGIFIASLAFAFATGYWLPARLANVILASIPLAYLWGWLNTRGLEVSVERPADRLQVDDDFEERITVHNRTWFTKLWLEIEDLSDLPGHQARRVISLAPRAQRSWRFVSTCTRRGLFAVGPVRVTTGDLFGLFRHSRTFGEAQHVLVYPRAIDLPRVAVPAAVLPGESRVRTPTQEITPNASGVREYQPGDALSRFHWRSTARTGELMVKLFERDPTSDLWIVLDLQRAVQAGEGDDGTEEHAVQIAASVARHFLFSNRSVGLVAAGAEFRVEEAARGLGQYTRILEALALAKAQGDVPLAELLDHEGRRFGRQTTLLVITPSTDDAWVASLQMLASRGVKRAAIVLEPNTFGGQRSALLVFSALAATDVTTYLVKRTDDLGAVFAAGVAGPEGGRP